MSIRVFVVEKRPMVLAGLRAMLSFDSSFEVAGERADTPIEREAVVRARPDVVLVGATVDPVGLAALTPSRSGSFAWRLVILGCSPGTSQVRAFSRAGACACVPLDAPGAVMRELLFRVAGCGSVGGPGCAARCPDTDAETAPFGLSLREREILTLLASGQTTSGIATALDLAPSTVSTFIRRI